MKINVAWTSLLFCGAVLGCNTHGPSAEPPVASPLFKPETASLAQQKMCDDQAEKKFNDYQSTDLRGKDKPLYSYTSHYDSTVNICYIRVHSFSGSFSAVSDVIYDAFGGRVYANYNWSNPLRKNAWEVLPTECAIYIPGKPVERCKSSEEFDALSDKYFGVTIG